MGSGALLLRRTRLAGAALAAAGLRCRCLGRTPIVPRRGGSFGALLAPALGVHAKFTPRLLGDLNTIVCGGLFDVGPGGIARARRNTGDLVEPRDRIAHMARVGQRLARPVRDRFRARLRLQRARSRHEPHEQPFRR